MRGPTTAERTAERDGIPRCEFCRAKIVWAHPVPSPNARSAAGRNPKPMPMDYEPSTEGRYTLYQDSGRLMVGELTRGQAIGWREAGKPTYQRHYRTCVRKDDWGQLGKPYGLRNVTR